MWAGIAGSHYRIHYLDVENRHSPAYPPLRERMGVIPAYGANVGAGDNDPGNRERYDDRNQVLGRWSQR